MGAVGIPVAGSVIMLGGSAMSVVTWVISGIAGGSAAPIIVDTGSVDVIEEAGAAAVDVSSAISSVV